MEAGYGEYKDEIVRSLTGTVLEIGAGRGANFGRFGGGVRWIGLEPDRRRAGDLGAAATRHGHREPVLVATAEAIPLPDGSVDAVLATIVLCSVSDVGRVLAEVRRVLRPGGGFAFFEHVGAPPGTWTRRLQRLYAPLSRRFDAGCDPTRDTEVSIVEAFPDVELRRFANRFSLYGPYVAGRAVN